MSIQTNADPRKTLKDLALNLDLPPVLEQAWGLFIDMLAPDLVIAMHAEISRNKDMGKYFVNNFIEKYDAIKQNNTIQIDSIIQSEQQLLAQA